MCGKSRMAVSDPPASIQGAGSTTPKGFLLTALASGLSPQSMCPHATGLLGNGEVGVCGSLDSCFGGILPLRLRLLRRVAREGGERRCVETARSAGSRRPRVCYQPVRRDACGNRYSGYGRRPSCALLPPAASDTRRSCRLRTSSEQVADRGGHSRAPHRSLPSLLSGYDSPTGVA